MAQVVAAVKELDVHGLPGRAKQIVQTDNIAEELDGYIERLSLLVDGLTVCQLAIATNIGERVLIHDVFARLKQYFSPKSRLRLVLLVIFFLDMLMTCDATFNRS